MRALVTGGAGFIGSHVADALLAAGNEVMVLDDLSTGRRENVPAGARFAHGSLRDPDFVRTTLADFRPDVVSHQGAQTSVSVSVQRPIDDAQTNILGTLNLLQAAVATGVERVVFASTGGAIYGEVAEGRRARVGDPTDPISPYACSKLAAEAYLRCFEAEHKLGYTVLRYANVYGPRQDPHGEAGVVAIFARRLLDGAGVHINARQTKGDPGCVRDYVFVADVVRANIAAVKGEVSDRIVNVCTGRGVTTLELLQRLQSALGVETQPSFAERRPGDLERSVLEPSEGSSPVAEVDLDDGLRKTAEWFRTASR